MFVIGDQNVAVGAQVTFWGAPWWHGHPGTGTIVGFVCGPDSVGGGVNPT